MPIIRKVKVTIEKEYLIELPDEFGNPEFIAEHLGYRRIKTVDQVAKLAAEEAAEEGSHYLGGLGWLWEAGDEPRSVERVTKFTLLDDETFIDSEIVEGD